MLVVDQTGGRQPCCCGCAGDGEVRIDYLHGRAMARARYPGGPALQQAGVEQSALKAQHIRRPERFAKCLHAAAMAQTVAIHGAPTAAQPVAELAGQLAAVLASSINANVPSRCGNHRLKNALFLAAFTSPTYAPSRTYYDGSALRASGITRPF
jgi:hypothetical protein